MNETGTVDPWVATETWVTYHGHNRQGALGGTKFKVVQANEQAAAFDAGIFGIQWCAKKYLRVAPTPEVKSEVKKVEPTDNIDQMFIEAAGGHRAVLVNEIARISARLDELKAALKVIDSL
jgi:hypothetical protein